jgi:Domain of Unknown Function (DUF1080)
MTARSHRPGALLAPLLLAGCLTPVGYRTGDGGPSGAAGGQGGSTGVGTGAAGTGGHAGSGGGPTTGTAGTNGTTGVAGHGAGGTAAPTGIAGTTGGSGTGAAGTSGAPPGTVLYMDNFDGDTVGSPPPPAAWIQGDTTTGLGTWTVVSDASNNVLQGAATGSDFTVDIGGMLVWTDYTFQVDVKMISGSSWEVGVYGRFAVGTDKANFYEAYMDDSGSVQLRVKQDGSTTTLGTKSKATTAPALNTVYTFKLDMHGSTITISVNGVVRVMVTDTTLTAGGIGVIVEGGTAEFDNVVVTK